MNRLSPFLIALLLVSGCIGTDILNSEIVPSRVEITTEVTSVRVGEQVQLFALFFDDLGELKDRSINWRSSDPGIIEVNQQGVASALAPGRTHILASVGAAADSLLIESGDTTMIIASGDRTGSFQGANNYDVSGDFSMVVNPATSAITLEFTDNFNSSNGPGLYVYLSNSSTSVSGGVNLGQLQKNSGVQSYPLPSQVGLSTYDFVIIYCQPFAVPFGYGQLNE